MKKIISAMLAVLMMVGLFAGCGGNSGKVELIWAIPFSEQKDTDKVVKEINKRLETLLPNTTIKLKLDPSMASKWALWMAGKTQVDIALSGYATDLASEINKNSYTALDSLVDKYAPTIKSEMTKYESLYQTGTMDGKLYAIPNVQIHINDAVYFGIPDSLKQYFDTEAFVKAVKENPTTTEVFYQIIDKYLSSASKNVDSTTQAPLISGVEHVFRNMVKRGYEFIGGNNSLLCYKVSDPECKVVSFYDTDEFKIYMKYAAKWYGDGYISKDILVGEDGVGNKSGLFSANITNFRISDVNGDGIITAEEAAETNAADQKSYKICMTPNEQKYSGTSVIGSLKTYCSIPTTSKNPERAMQLLELLRTEKGAEILNLLCYGIEGTHYEKLSDTEIKAFDYEGQGSSSSAYGIPNWELGNMFNEYTCYPYTKATVAAAEKYFNDELPNFTKTPVYGLSINNKNVENELAQMSAANDEFMLQLIGGTNGTANYMSTYEKLTKKLDAAGIEKVKKEYQSQIDAFIKK